MGGFVDGAPKTLASTLRWQATHSEVGKNEADMEVMRPQRAGRSPPPLRSAVACHQQARNSLLTYKLKEKYTCARAGCTSRVQVQARVDEMHKSDRWTCDAICGFADLRIGDFGSHFLSNCKCRGPATICLSAGPRRDWLDDWRAPAINPAQRRRARATQASKNPASLTHLGVEAAQACGVGAPPQSRQGPRPRYPRPRLRRICNIPRASNIQIWGSGGTS